MGPVGWGGVWLLSQTRPIPRSPDGDNNATYKSFIFYLPSERGRVVDDGLDHQAEEERGACRFF